VVCAVLGGHVFGWKEHAETYAPQTSSGYCRGEWGTPKSEASNATIAVNLGVIERIHWLKTVTVEVKAGTAVRRYFAVKATGPDDIVFASVSKGVPMRDNNILCRFIKPAGRKLGMGWVNWQVLKRSHATWLKSAGADVKDAQAQMRHSKGDYDAGDLSAVRARVAAKSSKQTE
jgi:hypothetical protein